MFNKKHITKYIKNASDRQAAIGNYEIIRKIESFRISYAGYGHVVESFARPRAVEIASLITGISPDSSKKFGYSHWSKIALHQGVEFVLMSWVLGYLSEEVEQDLKNICKTGDVAA